MGYVIVEWKKLKTQFPEFQEMVAALEQKTLSFVAQAWPGMTYGRFNPKQGQFGRTTFLPEHFRDANADILDATHLPANWGRNNFRQMYSDASPTAVALPGWKTILEGAQAGGITPEDVVMNLVGFAITDMELYITKLRLEIGDIVHVKLDIEEAQMYEQCAIIFEDGYTIPEETFFKLTGYFEEPVPGENVYQRVVPLGFIIYRRKDGLIHI